MIFNQTNNNVGKVVNDLMALFRNQARPDSLTLIKGGATAKEAERVQIELCNGAIDAILASDKVVVIYKNERGTIDIQGIEKGTTVTLTNAGAVKHWC